VAGFGLLWAWRWRQQWRFGAVLALAGIIVLLSVLFVVMPHYSPTGAPAMMNTQSSIDRFSWLSSPFTENSPLAGIAVAGALYLVQIVGVFWFLPLRELAWLLPGAADFTVNVLSTNMMMRSLASYHSVALMPVVVVAYAVAVKNRYTQQTRLKRTEVLAASAALCAWFATCAVLPFSQENNIWDLSAPKFAYLPGDAAARNAIDRMVPHDAAIAAQDNMLPHLSPRFRMYHFPAQLGDAQYVLLHTGFPFSKPYQGFGAPYSVSGKAYFTAAMALLADRNWGVAHYEHGWLLLERGHAGSDALKRQAQQALIATQAHYLKIKSANNL
jgi:uncharacterized membrane protein